MDLSPARSDETHYNTPEAKNNLKRFEEIFEKELFLKSAS